MARYPQKTAPEVDEPEEIVIERREVVGRVTLGPGGKPILLAAFEMMASYIGENLGSMGISLQFESYGRTFHAQVDPDASLLQTTVEDDEDYH